MKYTEEQATRIADMCVARGWWTKPGKISHALLTGSLDKLDRDAPPDTESTTDVYYFCTRFLALTPPPSPGSDHVFLLAAAWFAILPRGKTQESPTPADAMRTVHEAICDTLVSGEAVEKSEDVPDGYIIGKIISLGKCSDENPVQGKTLGGMLIPALGLQPEEGEGPCTGA